MAGSKRRRMSGTRLDDVQCTKDHEETTNSDPKASLLSSSIQGATFLVLLQVGARGLTFAVNQLLLRHMSPESLAISTQLDIYLISTLYFARESIRVALQRQTDESPDRGQKEKDDIGDAGSSGGSFRRERSTKSGTKTEAAASSILDDLSAAGKTQIVVNISYVSLFLGIPLAAGLAMLYLRSASGLSSQTPYFRESLAVYGLSAIAELLTEPCFVVAQQKMLYGLRAKAESMATLTRCVMTCCIVLIAARRSTDLGVLPFALGQLAYATMLVFVYFWSTLKIARDGGFSLIMHRIAARNINASSRYILGYYSRPLVSLSGSLFVQSAVKHVLTQGDSLLIATLASLRDQGVYALASNYGGLLARLLFQPIEESSRNLFAKLLALDDTGRPTRQGLESARKVLSDILRLYILLTILASSFGPTTTPHLLSIVAGPRWAASGAGHVLATYCYYIPLLALNGVTEAFVSAVATPAQLNVQSMWMFAFSVGFASAGYIFIRVLGWGAEGLVWANAVNMALRIMWSAHFVDRYFRGTDHERFNFVRVLPKPATLATGIGAAAVAWRMQLSAAEGFQALAKFVPLAAGSIALM